MIPVVVSAAGAACPHADLEKAMDLADRYTLDELRAELERRRSENRRQARAARKIGRLAPLCFIVPTALFVAVCRFVHIFWIEMVLIGAVFLGLIVVGPMFLTMAQRSDDLPRSEVQTFALARLILESRAQSK